MSTDLPPSSVDLSNWRTAPFSRWAFHNIRAILPVAEIESAPGSAWPLLASVVSFDDFSVRLPKGGTLDLDGFLKATATDGLLILHDGRIVFEHYDGGTDRDTPHILMSATKSITGLMVGILAGRGELDIDAEVTRYVPEVAATAYRGATIRQLLDMRAGVVFDGASLQAYADAAGWEPVAPGTTPSLHDFFATMRVQAAPHGGAFSYVSSNTDLLGWAIERATGRSFASLVGSLLWKPMGASGEAFITPRPQGARRAAPAGSAPPCGTSPGSASSCCQAAGAARRRSFPRAGSTTSGTMATRRRGATANGATASPPSAATCTIAAAGTSSTTSRSCCSRWAFTARTCSSMPPTGS
ncbi:serine hydrolase domain-containing protein [Bradyrhizobium oligotrophicum S58]